MSYSPVQWLAELTTRVTLTSDSVAAGSKTGVADNIVITLKGAPHLPNPITISLPVCCVSMSLNPYFVRGNSGTGNLDWSDESLRLQICKVMRVGLKPGSVQMASR